MKNNKYERLSEIIIGEAVLSLLSEHSSVSWHAVLKKIEELFDTELSNEKTCAAMLAMQDVKREIGIRHVRLAGSRVMMPAANDNVNMTQ